MIRHADEARAMSMEHRPDIGPVLFRLERMIDGAARQGLMSVTVADRNMTFGEGDPVLWYWVVQELEEAGYWADLPGSAILVSWAHRKPGPPTGGVA